MTRLASTNVTKAIIFPYMCRCFCLTQFTSPPCSLSSGLCQQPCEEKKCLFMAWPRAPSSAPWLIAPMRSTVAFVLFFSYLCRRFCCRCPICQLKSHQCSKKVTELDVWGVCALLLCVTAYNGVHNHVHVSKKLFKASRSRPIVDLS